MLTYHKGNKSKVEKVIPTFIIYLFLTTTGSQLIYFMVKTPFFLWSSLFFQRLRRTSHTPVKRSKHTKTPQKGLSTFKYQQALLFKQNSCGNKNGFIQFLGQLF